MTILCCGDRKWRLLLPIMQRLGSFSSGHTVVVHGDAPGADKLCDAVARYLGMAVQPYPADWVSLGKKAGPIRNQAMLDRHPEIELVIAFHANLAESKGTADMVARARKAGIPVEIITGCAPPSA